MDERLSLSLTLFLSFTRTRTHTHTVDGSSDAALAEHQVVLGQSAGLVAQQVTHLTQLLIQGRVPGLSPDV